MLFESKTEEGNRVLKKLKISTLNKYYWVAKLKYMRRGGRVVRMETLIKEIEVLKQEPSVRNKL
jgi:fatty acid-binding protein DegV